MRAEVCDGAAQGLLNLLKKELTDKISSAERQAEDYRRVLHGMQN